MLVPEGLSTGNTRASQELAVAWLNCTEHRVRHWLGGVHRFRYENGQELFQVLELPKGLK